MLSRSLKVLGLILAGSTASADSVSLNSQALFSVSTQHMVSCAEETTSNYALSSAIIEPVYEKAHRDVVRTINQCITFSQKEDLLKGLLTVGSAAMFTEGCDGGYCSNQDYENTAKLLLATQEHVVDIFSTRLLNKLRSTCLNNISAACVTAATKSVDYEINTGDLDWASLTKVDRIASIKDPVTEKIFANAGKTGDYMIPIIEALNAARSGTSNSYLPLDVSIVPILKPNLPKWMRVLPNNTIRMDIFPNPVHIKGHGFQFKVVTDVNINECRAIMKNISAYGATEVYINYQPAPRKVQKGIERYCGPTTENNLTLLY